MTKKYQYHDDFHEMPFFIKRYQYYKNQTKKSYTRLAKAIDIYNSSNSFEGKKVLDIGCNFGYWSVILNQLGADVTGIDLSDHMIEIAKDFTQEVECNKSNIDIQKMDLLNNSFPDNHFDIVYFMEVIEHVNSPVDFLKAINRIIKPGGSLIISTPNAINTFSILKQLWPNIKGLIKNIETEKIDTGTHLDHIYDWNIFAFYRLLYRNNFEYKKHDFITLEIPYICQIPIKSLPILSRFSRGMIFNVTKKELQ